MAVTDEEVLVEITHALHIDAPVETVFDFLEDEQRQKAWMEELEATIYLADYDRASPVGARFTQRIREGTRVTEYDGEIIVHSRPHRLAVRLWNDDLTAEIDYLLHAEDGGTRLEYSAELWQASGLGRAMAELFGWLTRRSLIDQLGSLKRVAEAAPASGAGDAPADVPVDVLADDRLTGEALETEWR